MIILGVREVNSLESKEMINKYREFIRKMGSEEEILIAEKHNWKPAQLYEISEGVKSGVDVSIYAKPYYNEYKMGLIRLAIEQDLEYESLLDPSLDEFVLREMYFNLENTKI